MNCESIQMELSACLDGELSQTRMKEVQTHLSNCSQCREVFQLLESTRTVFRETKSSRVSEDFQNEVKEAFYHNKTGPTHSWLRLAAPVALAASLALVFFWNSRDASPTGPTGPMSGPEIYEQMLTMDSPGMGHFWRDDPSARTLDDSPGMKTEIPGVDPDNSIPGMGDFL